LIINIPGLVINMNNHHPGGFYSFLNIFVDIALCKINSIPGPEMLLIWLW